jgi:hypothetical protein
MSDESSQETMEEALGRRLEEHLEALAGGRQPATDAPAEAAPLLQVVTALYRLRESLRPAGTMSRDEARTPTGPYHPAPMQDTPRLGKYELVRPLGEGGQGTAFLAFDPDLRRHVVVKCYHGGDDDERETILREGRALARVRSPFVAGCLGAERHEGTPYLVMEYVPGENLAQRLRRGPLAPDQALLLVEKLAEGLAAVHTCGLLHRDVKPGNVVIGDDGLPRLVDFGLASPVAGDGLHQVIGTLAYMAPEQARGQGERIDPRTDVYGLGAVLYALLTGGPPHPGKDAGTLWRQARQGDVEPAHVRRPGVPPAVSELCARCLAKDPAARFGSAAEVVQAVKRCRWRLRQRRWRPALAAVAALLAVMGGAAAYLATRGQDRTDAPQGPGEAVEAPGGDDTALPVEVEMVGGRKDERGLIHLSLGQKVAFRVKTARDAYVGLWSVQDDGSIVQLFPNKHEPDHLIKAGPARTIPGNDYAIKATSVSRRPEEVIVFGSTRRWQPPSREQFRSVGPDDNYLLFETAHQRQEFQALLRGLEVVSNEPIRGVAVAVRSAKVVLRYEVKAAKRSGRDE